MSSYLVKYRFTKNCLFVSNINRISDTIDMNLIVSIFMDMIDPYKSYPYYIVESVITVVKLSDKLQVILDSNSVSLLSSSESTQLDIGTMPGDVLRNSIASKLLTLTI